MARSVASHLAKLGAGHALVGGFAVSVRTEPRFTRDLDFCVAVDDDDGAEGIAQALLQSGYQILSTAEQRQVGRLASVRMSLTDGDGLVDLLFASSGIEGEVVSLAETIEVLPAVVLPVAQVGHLIALKLLARDDRSRPQDSVDLRALGAIATEEDLVLARQGVMLIEARGYQRGRDLASAFDDFVDNRP